MKNKEDYLKFNINHYVLVKLNDLGYKTLVDDHNSYSDIVGWKPKSVEDFKKEADENGYMKFQMWDFMSKFGNDIGLGFEERFETTVLIHKSDIVI